MTIETQEMLAAAVPEVKAEARLSTDSDSSFPAYSSVASASAALATALLASACGGGSSDSASGGASSGTGVDSGQNAVPATSEQASRFLAQASMGTTSEQIAQVKSRGFEGWLEAQFSTPSTLSRWDWLISKGFNAPANRYSQQGFDACVWRKLLSSPDTLRQRVTLALSELMVVGIDGISGGWTPFAGAAYLDLLEANAFGNFRTLLEQVSTSTAMGTYLTFRGNVKYNATTGAMPDENYARELMQLFTIGLYELNLDGTPKLQDGKPKETYALDDITGLARVFTGWDFDRASGDITEGFHRRPMVQVAKRHETDASSFLGSTVAAGLNGQQALTSALDIIFAHPNVAPFVSRQLIQHLVTSNPRSAYIARVATIFNNDGKGIKGNMQAVIKAILLDTEARSDAGLTDPSFGKLREPMLRFCAWARAFGVTSPTDLWNVGNTSDTVSRLGQSPLRSASVFNFFRPGYIPPSTDFAKSEMVAPEFQITNESTIVGYMNFMQTAISRGIGEVKADYTSLLALVTDSAALVSEISLLLVGGQLSASTGDKITGAIDSMPKDTDARRLNQVYAALVLVMASPEFIAQK